MLSLKSFVAAVGKYRLHSLALLVAVFGTCSMFKLQKKCTPLRDNCKDGTILCYLLLLEKKNTKKLALPDLSYCLSQGRCLIHIWVVRKELKGQR